MPAIVPAVAAETILATEVMAAEAAAAAAAEAAAVEAATAAATQAAATAAAEQAATAAATEAATTAGAQAATTGAADAATQEAIRQQLAANAGQAGLPSIAPSVSPLQPTGIESLGTVPNVAVPEAAAVQPPAPNFVESAMNAPADRFASTSANFPQTSPGFAESAMNNPAAQPGAAMNTPYQSYNPNAEMLQGSGVNTLPPGMTGASTTGIPPDASPGWIDKGLDWVKDNKLTTASLGLQALNAMNKKDPAPKEKYNGPLSKFKFNPDVYQPYEPKPPNPTYRAQYATYAGGGPIEAMSNANAVGANTGYPMADIQKGAYATPYQTPISRNVVGGVSDTGVNPMTGEMQFAAGGISSLGGYSDYARGGRMLKGPGDGMSDDIPATIANKQPARLANEEFVVPADVVSHLGNGSSEAGAKALYKMMDRVRQARTGKKSQGKQINPEKYLA